MALVGTTSFYYEMQDWNVIFSWVICERNKEIMNFKLMYRNLHKINPWKYNVWMIIINYIYIVIYFIETAFNLVTLTIYFNCLQKMRFKLVHEYFIAYFFAHSSSNFN